MLQHVLPARADFLRGDQPAVVHPVMVRAQHRHVLDAVIPAVLPADDVRDVARGFCPAAQAALVAELTADYGAKRVMTCVDAVGRPPPGHDRAQASRPAVRVAVDVLAVNGLPDRDAHAGYADPELGSHGRHGRFLRLVASAAFRGDLRGQLLRSPGVLAGRALLRRQVLNRLTAVRAGCCQPGQPGAGRVRLLVRELAVVTAELSRRCLTRIHRVGGAALKARYLNHELILCETLGSDRIAEFTTMPANEMAD